MNHFRSFIFLALLIATSFYSYWLSNKDYEWVVPYMSERAPAAVRDSHMSDLVDKPLRVFKREAVASSIDILNKDGQYKFTMGQFAVMGNKGANLMCIEYPFIKLSMQGEGVVVAGKKAKLFVIAPCRLQSRNQDVIRSIPIPFEQLYRQPAQDQDIEYTQDGMTGHAYLKDVNGNLPKQWQLESVQFLRDTNDYLMDSPESIGEREIFMKKGEPVLVRVVQ
ncbi:MAG: hypothetical protein H6623_09465 [Bdellovibrionaceae bacterium]|nr:hypothetical protein [Pseudobdellovibrionaceae bacterium]